MGDDVNDLIANGWRLNDEVVAAKRERDEWKARAETAERDLTAARQALTDAERERDEARAEVADLRGQIENVNWDAIEKALSNREREWLNAIDRLRAIAPPEHEDEVHALTRSLRDAICFVGCLRRLTRGRSVSELHAAFGAPGDFGYETDFGDALARAYGVR